jgi:hypothetical protein
VFWKNLSSKLFFVLPRKALLGCLFFISIFCVSASKTHAAIGTHLGVGDPGHQMAIMDIIASKGVEAGFPVTIMVDAGTGSDTIQQFANKVREHNFFPIVRINYACDSGRNPVATAQSVRSIFDATVGSGRDNYIITFGNEVNNQDSDQVGCTNWSAYASNYRSIVGPGNLSPSALDWYMGLAEYNAQLFLNNSGMSGDYSSAPIRTANAYGCIGGTSATCDTAGYDTWQTGAQGISQPFYLTEFSLSPGGDDPPDLDLENVINFIQTVGPNTGAIHITPLVRNVCEEYQGEGEWLLYVNGNLYTSVGTQVDPQSCTATNPSKVITPRDRDDYFIYPLNMNPDTDWATGVTPLDERTNEVLWNLVYDQGYQVLCPSENMTIKKNVLDAINRYFELYPVPPNFPYEAQSSSLLRANATDAKIPLYRGNEIPEETQKTSSLEGYFGALNLEQENPMVGSGVANNLLSVRQQCRVKHDNAMVTNELCQKLEDPGTCAIDKTIRDSDYTPSGLFWAMNEHLIKDESIALNCDDWILPWESLEEARPEAAADIGQEEFQDIQTALQNYPIIPDMSYRMAYLVITPLQNPEDTLDSFWFLANKDKNSANHAPIFIGIKIPDTLTNRAYSASFADAAMLSSNALKEANIIEDQYNMEVGRREGLLSNVAAAQVKRINALNTSPTEPTNQIINCNDMPRCTEGTEEMPLYIREALLDMINGEGNACGGGGGVVEDAGDIFSYADATKKAGSRTFTGDFLDGIISQNGNQNFQWGLEISSAGEANGPFINPVNNPSSANNIPVMIHLVAPLGSNLHDIQEGFWALFNTETRAMIESEAPDFYPIKDIQFGFDDEVKKSFWDPDRDCGTAIDPITGLPVTLAPCDNNDFTIELTDKGSDKSVNYPGAKLGWLVKKMQETFNAISTAAYEYVVSCETTEDMFLGRCAGGSLASGSGSTTSPYGYDTCGLKLGTGYCAPENLEPYFIEAGFSAEEAGLEADKASRICQRESGGSPYAFNDRCIQGTSVDYSVGLFQINMLPRCPGSFRDASGNPDTSASYDPYDIPCEITDQERLNSCALDKLAIGSNAAGRINSNLPPGATPVNLDTYEEEQIKAENNIRAMVEIRRSWGNWGAWTAGAGNCSIE